MAIGDNAMSEENEILEENNIPEVQVSDFEIPVLDLEEYEDVGEMSKDEFNRLSSTASFIQEDDILVSLLSDVS